MKRIVVLVLMLAMVFMVTYTMAEQNDREIVAEFEAGFSGDSEDRVTMEAIASLYAEIAELRKMIDTQDDGVGKVSGAAVYVSDALAKTPLSLRVYGRTVQDGIPSISNPIMPMQIDGTNGNVQIRIRGKNLVSAKETTLTACGPKDLTINVGTANGVVPGHTYTFSVKLTKANVQKGAVWIRAYDKNRSLIKQVGQTILGDGKLSLTFTVPDAGIKNIYILLREGVEGDTITLTDMQLEVGDTATVYEPYVEHKTVNVAGMTNAFHGIPVENGGNYTDENGQQYICDVIDYTNGVIERHCGYIASYAGETIPGAYVSSTGSLANGSTIVYALAKAEITELPAASITEYSKIVLNAPNTEINSLFGSWISMEYERMEKAEANETMKVQAAFDPTHYGMTILWLEGDTTGMNKDDAVDLRYRFKNLEGTASVKWQGSSSLWFDKKNYTVKFDQAFEVVEGWGAQKKYCFKANFIDHSHARNICCAKLWGQVVKSRDVVPNHFANLPNGGAIDGIPCAIMLNNEFHGLFTWNIPKDGWMMGMSEGNREAIVCAEGTTSAAGFKETITELDTEYSYEYSLDENDTDWIVESLNRLITACQNSDGTDLDTTIAQYLDWDSAIDSYIFTVLTSGHDNVIRNYLLVTFDGVKWYFSQYDMDETFGQTGSGTNFRTSYAAPTFETNANRHLVYELIWLYKRDELIARYEELRNGVMSELNVCGTFANFIKDIPPHALMADLELYPTIPSAAMSNYAQISHYYSMRVKETDKEIKKN